MEYVLPHDRHPPPQVASLSDRASEAMRTALLITHDVVQMLAQEIRTEGLDELFAVRFYTKESSPRECRIFFR